MATVIEGSVIRKQLRDKGIPGGKETVCCGGRIRFSRDYETQLRRLKYPKGEYTIKERGVVSAFISLS